MPTSDGSPSPGSAAPTAAHPANKAPLTPRQDQKSQLNACLDEILKLDAAVVQARRELAAKDGVLQSACAERDAAVAAERAAVKERERIAAELAAVAAERDRLAAELSELRTTLAGGGAHARDTGGQSADAPATPQPAARDRPGSPVRSPTCSPPTCPPRSAKRARLDGAASGDEVEAAPEASAQFDEAPGPAQSDAGAAGVEKQSAGPTPGSASAEKKVTRAAQARIARKGRPLDGCLELHYHAIQLVHGDIRLPGCVDCAERRGAFFPPISAQDASTSATQQDSRFVAVPVVRGTFRVARRFPFAGEAGSADASDGTPAARPAVLTELQEVQAAETVARRLQWHMHAQLRLMSLSMAASLESKESNPRVQGLFQRLVFNDSKARRLTKQEVKTQVTEGVRKRLQALMPKSGGNLSGHTGRGRDGAVHKRGGGHRKRPSGSNDPREVWYHLEADHPMLTRDDVSFERLHGEPHRKSVAFARLRA